MRQLVLITGFSGAGKSTVVRTFEDGGFFCVDNLPPSLLSGLAAIAAPAGNRPPTAAVCDARSGMDLGHLIAEVGRLDEAGHPPFLIFLEADGQTLINRYKETRRRHPLAGAGTVNDGIAAERALLGPLRDRADMVIDTSTMGVAELTSHITTELLDDAPATRTLTFISYGHKYGPLRDADLCFDVRFLPNPYYEIDLRPLTGLDRAVREYVHRAGILEEFYGHAKPMIDFLLPHYTTEGKHHLVVGIGCTGGRHRSVAIAEELYAHYADRQDFQVSVYHRDIGRNNHQYERS